MQLTSRQAKCALVYSYSPANQKEERCSQLQFSSKWSKVSLPPGGENRNVMNILKVPKGHKRDHKL